MILADVGVLLFRLLCKVKVYHVEQETYFIVYFCARLKFTAWKKTCKIINDKVFIKHQVVATKIIRRGQYQIYRTFRLRQVEMPLLPNQKRLKNLTRFSVTESNGHSQLHLHLDLHQF